MGRSFSEGEVYRYLAELPWVPQAMLANRQLEWRELDARTVEVAMRFGSARLPVRLEFDAAGAIVGSSAEARPRLAGKRSVRTPWAASFGDYLVLGEIRIPTRAEAHWRLQDGAFTYWRGAITSLETD